ncbi:MAG: tRNA (adenosine(37)-N6)-threonylcarbamoyltransferase complex ATPase subunit type 1 TsaE [Chitinophagaceae bacterium]|nr:MAG: tRNA (adenosine(37)-N6)-threonylcarbamoyltransferase complex ATPase subunit type 1 TsaE [Chitinophagaceae bacterium]
MENVSNSKIFENYTEQDLPEVGKLLSEMLKDTFFMTFKGDLGAGKTTLIKEILINFQLESDFSSPTYSIVNEYKLNDADFRKAYHMDLYRLKHIDEAHEIGLTEYWDEDKTVCLIEWPEIAADILPEKCINISIFVNANGSRKLIID